FLGLFHRDLIGLHPYFVRVEHRSATLDIELPSVPRALDDLVFSTILHLEGPGGQRGAGHFAQAERSPMMWAGVPQRVERPLNVEYPDRRAVHVNNTTSARRELAQPGNDML